MKRIWLTSLISDKETLARVTSPLAGYGLEARGHQWQDDLEQMAWRLSREELVDPGTSLWVILASRAALTPPVRYGLALLALAVKAARGTPLPLVVLGTDSQPLDPLTLPTPLRGADILDAATPALTAKLVAKVHGASPAPGDAYRLDCYGNPHIGQWFELGPTSPHTWNGACFGVAGGTIAFQAVGPCGQLPEKSTLAFPVQGLEIALRARTFSAWGVQNELDGESAYFVKVEGHPEALVFGEFPGDETAELFVLELQ